MNSETQQWFASWDSLSIVQFVLLHVALIASTDSAFSRPFSRNWVVTQKCASADNPYSRQNRDSIIVVLITLVTNALRLHSHFLASGQLIIQELSKRVAEYHQSKDPLFYSTIALRKSRQNRRVMSENQTIRHFSASLSAHDSKTCDKRTATQAQRRDRLRQRWLHFINLLIRT